MGIEYLLWFTVPYMSLCWYCVFVLLEFLFVFCSIFKTRSLCVVLASLELAMQTRKVSNLEILLPLPRELWDSKHVPPYPGTTC